MLPADELGTTTDTVGAVAAPRPRWTTLVASIAVGTLVVIVAAPASAADPPTDYRTALADRLADEWADRALAGEVVTGLDAAFLATLEARVPLADVATSPFLAYRPERRPAKAFDSVIVYAFGYRDGVDGARDPGPTNAALADATQKLLAKRTLPVYAQTEIAEVLAARGVRGVTSIDPVTGPDGATVYLSTAGVAAQAAAKATAAGKDLGTVAVVAFADHAGRSVLTTGAAGLDAAVAKGVALPATYDPASAQPWTRDRRTYLATDLVGRVSTL